MHLVCTLLMLTIMTFPESFRYLENLRNQVFPLSTDLTKLVVVHGGCDFFFLGGGGGFLGIIAGHSSQ